jgi:hypothetical protein
MKNGRLAGGVALAVLLILLTAATALASTGPAPDGGGAPASGLPLVASASYVSPGADGFTCVAPGPGNIVYAAGYAQQNRAATSSLLLLVKYTDDGAALHEAWHVLAGYGSRAKKAVKVAVDSRGNVIVASTAGPYDSRPRNGFIMVDKYRGTDGSVVWSTFYDGPGHGPDYVKALALDAHDDVILCGASAGRGTGRDYVTLKLRASDGKRRWVRRYAGPSDYDEARGIAADPAGNVYVTGQSRAKPTNPRYSGQPREVTVSYGPGGRQRWIVVDKDGRTTSGNGLLYCAVPGAEGVIVSGIKTPKRQRHEHVYFAKYRTSDGALLWSRTPTSGAREGEWSLDAALGPDGEPVAAGYRDGDALLTGVSATGDLPWDSTFRSAFEMRRAEFDAVTVAADGRVLAAGSTASGKQRWPRDVPTTFLVRFSSGLPVSAPLDYGGGGGATSFDACTGVAIGEHGMYAVGRRAEGRGDSDAVLLKF